MIPSSIRWRLPLSYAGIALIAALALGGVLLTTLRGYYAQQERDFLERNNRFIAFQVEGLLAAGTPMSELQPLLTNFSFVSRARVQLKDRNGGILGDSGSFEPINTITFSFERQDQFQQAGAVAVDAVPGDYIASIIVGRGGEVATATTGGHTLGEPRPTEPGIFAVSAAPFEIMTTPFGYDMNPDMNRLALNPHRSSERVTTPLFDPNNQFLGSVVLSEGPAYGTEIVNNVARGLIMAGGIAVLLAAIIGWFVSRTITEPLLALTQTTGHMAEGQLSARVQLNRKDEFGLLAQSFNEMAGRVESTVSMLRRFVADAAHELHTPITALHTNLELAVNEPDPAVRTGFVERAQSQLKRLEKLTSSLLDLARIEANTIEEKLAPLNLVALVQQMNEIYASRAEQAGLSLQIELPDQPITVQANEAQVVRVIDNLLENALKFTPEEGAILIGVQQQANEVRLWVKDTGIGIPAEDLPNLFNRFYRGRNVSAYPGNGLGLVIIKTIIESHGGNVSVDSGGGGTQFSIRLPAA